MKSTAERFFFVSLWLRLCCACGIGIGFGCASLFAAVPVLRSVSERRRLCAAFRCALVAFLYSKQERNGGVPFSKKSLLNRKAETFRLSCGGGCYAAAASFFAVRCAAVAALFFAAAVVAFFAAFFAAVAAFFAVAATAAAALAFS